MKRFIGKLGFIHNRLWQQDGSYRAALLLGPAPLFGALVAAVIWGGILGLKEMTYRPPVWATPSGHETWRTGADQPQALQPAKPLPQSGAADTLAGYEPGWNVVANPIQVGPTLDVDVKTSSLTGFTIKGPSVDMEQILAGGPKTSLYVGVGSGFFVVREPGIYALSARFERSPGPIANCLTRLGFGAHRIVSTLNVNLVGAVSKDYEAAWFDLRPGLYRIGWALGCWHDTEVIGPGRMTILVARPGESALLPARADDFVR